MVRHHFLRLYYIVMHYSRCTPAALGASNKFPARLLLMHGLRERFLSFVLVVRQAVADLMLAASDVMDYLGNSSRWRNTSGSY